MTKTAARNCYAIVPAAGHSQRMGRPKLLLAWRQGFVVDAVLAAWTASRVSRTVVVVRQDDEPLRQACEKWPVDVVCATDPPDMKASVQIGLQYLGDTYSPGHRDACFVAPADLPMLTSAIIDHLVGEPFDLESTILAPRFGDKSGHPVLLPWALTDQIFRLGSDQGVNQVVKQNLVQHVLFPESDRVTDIDTPESYQAALRAANQQP